MAGWTKVKEGNYYVLIQPSVSLADPTVQKNEVNVGTSLFRLYELKFGDEGIIMGYQLLTVHPIKNHGSQLLVFRAGSREKEFDTAEPDLLLKGNLCIFKLGSEIALVTTPDCL